MGKGKLAIVGIGEVPTGIYPDRSRWNIIYEICRQAVQDLFQRSLKEEMTVQHNSV